MNERPLENVPPADSDDAKVNFQSIPKDLSKHLIKIIGLGAAYGMGSKMLSQAYLAEALWKVEPLKFTEVDFPVVEIDPLADFVPKSKEQERREQLARFPKNRKKMRY